MIIDQTLQQRIRSEILKREPSIKAFCRKNSINHSWLSEQILSARATGRKSTARIREVVRHLGLME